MVETISDKKVKAKKEHKCQWCGEVINIGEYYERAALKYDGDLYTWKNHIKCRELCRELDMVGNGDGITEDNFNDYVNEYLSENMSEDEWDEWSLGGEASVDKAIEILKAKENK